MNIESALIDRIGDVAKVLHTARSRNDQVATDIRLYLRHAVDHILEQISVLDQILVDLADREKTRSCLVHSLTSRSACRFWAPLDGLARNDQKGCRPV